MVKLHCIRRRSHCTATQWPSKLDRNDTWASASFLECSETRTLPHKEYDAIDVCKPSRSSCLPHTQETMGNHIRNNTITSQDRSLVFQCHPATRPICSPGLQWATMRKDISYARVQWAAGKIIESRGLNVKPQRMTIAELYQSMVY